MFSCLFSDNMAQDSATIENGCGSSVVEHSLGKGEVESSILSRSTIFFSFFLSLLLSISLPLSAQKSPSTQLSTINETKTQQHPFSPLVKQHLSHQLSVNLTRHEGTSHCPSNMQHKSRQNRPHLLFHFPNIFPQMLLPPLRP